MRVCLGECREDRRTVGDVECEREHRVAVRSDEGVQAGDVAGSGDDEVTAFERSQSPLPAEAARRTGDEPGLGAHVVAPSMG